MSTSTLHRFGLITLTTLGILGGGIGRSAQAEIVTQAAAVAKVEVAARYVYPEAVVSSFVNTCANEPSQLPPEIKRQLCTCLVTEFQNQYSYSEFEAIGKTVQSGELPPKEIGETVERCVEKVLKVQR